jgi:hypothetical protein
MSQTVICVKCKECHQIATTALKWVTVVKTDEQEKKELYCTCGGKEWIFIEMAANMIGPEVLVINKEMVRM